MGSETTPVVPRSAATVLVVRDDPFEVLLVRRPARGTFASALVFPGGSMDPDDADPAWLQLVTGADALSEGERAVRICGIREVFEETGMLLGAAAHAPLAADRLPFRDAVRASGLLLDLDALVPFAHWITPAGRGRRFDTRFLLARAPEGQVVHIDGEELVGSEWMRPAEFVRRGADDLTILFPTLSNVTRLAQSGTVEEAITAAREREPFVVQPTLRTDDDGTVIVEIPAEAGYPITSRIIPESVRA